MSPSAVKRGTAPAPVPAGSLPLPRARPPASLAAAARPRGGRGLVEAHAVVRLGGAERLWLSLRWLVTLMASATALGLVFYVGYVGPNARQDWRDVLPGTVWAAHAWIGASLGLSAYLRWLPSYTNAYGVIGALIVLFLWLYVISLVVLTGGLLNAPFRRSRSLRPPQL